MQTTKTHGVDAYSFSETARLARDFEALLIAKGIDIAPGGVLEDLLLSTAEVEYLQRRLTAVDPRADIRELFQKLIGIADLVKKIVVLQAHANFDELLGHLRLLNGSDPLQTKQARYRDRDSNKLFELYVACLVMRVGSDVLVEDPNRSRGDNPDVMATIDGVRWGFACKVPYSRTARSILDNIARGVGQLDKASVDSGAVVLSARNILERASFWPMLDDTDPSTGEPLYGAFDTEDIPARMLEAEALDLQQDLVSEIGLQELARVFRGHRSVSGFLLHAMVASSIKRDSGPVPMSVSRMMVVQVEGLDHAQGRVACLLNDAAQWSPKDL